MKFARNEVLEQWLSTNGIDFDLKTSIPSDRIDRKRSRQNMARQTAPLIEDNVMKLAVAIEEGAVFNPLIAWKNGAKYVLCDGNHRHEANELNGCGPVDLYVLRTDDRLVIEEVTRFANNVLNGVGQSQHERLRHAMHMHQKYNVPLVKCAALASVKLCTMQRFARIDKLRQELFALDLGGVEDLPGCVIEQLGKLDGNAKTMVAAAELAQELSLSKRDMQLLVERVQSVPKTESEQLAAIDEFRKRYGTESQVRVADKHTKAGRRLISAVNRLRDHLVRFPTAESNAINSATDKALMKESVVELTQHLVALRATLEV